MATKPPYHIEEINGIQTVFYPIKALPSVKIELVIHAGAWYEQEGYRGAFHLIEHLTHHGSKKFKNRTELELYKESHGLSSNAYTGGDRLGYWIKAPFYSLPQAVEMLNDLVFHPKLPQERFPKEIDVIEQEYRDYWDNPYQRFGHAIDEQIYGEDHPYTRTALGEPSTLRNLTQTDLHTLHQNFFTAPNMVLSVTGNFKLDETIALLQQSLEPQTHQPPSITHQVPALHPSKNLLRHPEDVQQRQILLSWPIPGHEQLTLKQRLEFGVISYILGGSGRSLLYERLREQMSIAYRTGSGKTLYPQAGDFNVWLSTDPKNEAEALSALKEVTYSFVNSPADQSKFNRAISFMNASTIINFDSIDEISSSITTDLFRKGKIYLPQDYIEIAKTISPDQILEFARHYITPKKEFTSILTTKSTP